MYSSYQLEIKYRLSAYVWSLAYLLRIHYETFNRYHIITKLSDMFV